MLSGLIKRPTQGPGPREGGTKPPCIPRRDRSEGDNSLLLDAFPSHSLTPVAQSSISG
jgi:hypothetical protein